MSIWLLLSYALAMLAVILAAAPVAVPNEVWIPLLTISLAGFAVGVAKSGIRRPVV